MVTVTSGLPMCHWSMSLNCRGGGMSAGLPIGAPLSTHLVMVATSESLKDGSSLNWAMPMFRSMYQGGISRLRTFSLIARAQGLASSYVSSGIGAIASGRWQTWHERCKIGATSFVKVTGCAFAAVIIAPAIIAKIRPAVDIAGLSV